MYKSLVLSLMKISCIFAFFLSMSNAQEKRFAYELFSSKSQEVKANAGEDIKAPSNTTILLDASLSTPKKGL